MTWVVAATVIAFGVLFSLYVNYLAWSWILGVRRRTRVRRLSHPDESPPYGSGMQRPSEELNVESPDRS